MDTSVKISIIVPIYNVEQYLKQCVDSVLRQTYPNFQLILVDDGSTDASGKICDQYKAADSRVAVVHKENGGLSSARQAGVNFTSSPYTMFLDGDDWLAKDTLEKCVNAVQSIPDIDCVMFSYARELKNKSVDMHILDGTRLFCGDEAKDEIYRRLFGLTGEELAHPARMENMVSCCMKLYKTEFVRQGRYYDTKDVGSGEDGLFNLYAMYGMNRVYYIDEPLYRYRKSGNSATSSYRPDLVNQWNCLYSVMDSVIEEKKLPAVYLEALNNRIALGATSIGLNYLNTGFISFLRVMRTYLMSERYRPAVKQLNISQMPILWKVFMLCCRYRCVLPLYFGLRIVSSIKGW